MDWIFFGIEGILYLAYMFLDLFCTSQYEISNHIKFLSIFICLIYTLICYQKIKTTGYKVLTISMIFIFISDFYILILSYYNIGVFTFFIAQLFLLGYLFLMQKKFTFRRFLGRTTFNILTSLVLLWSVQLFSITIDWLLIISAVYFITFFYNLVEAIGYAIPNKKSKSVLFASGMLLYFLCDINVGIFNTMSYVETSNLGFQVIYEFATIAMWMFYLPGILLIIRSGRY